jgi:hypothetical protein
MKNKSKLPINLITLASILAFANFVFASPEMLNHRTSFPQRAVVIPNHGSVVAQGGMLRERLHEREQVKTREVEEELEKNPKLVNDPNYMAQHPRLAQYLSRHPESKQKIEQNPKAFFAEMEKRESISPR